VPHINFLIKCIQTHALASLPTFRHSMLFLLSGLKE